MGRQAYRKELQRKKVKKPVKYIAAFFALALFLLLILYLAAKIPREMIRDNCLASAEYLNALDLFGYGIEGVEASKNDHYADSVLLNIGWNFDETYTLRSIMLAAYYYSPENYENGNFLATVRDGMEANQQYLRYWHGSLAIMRPLLVIMPVQGIYILDAVVLALLFAALLIRLIRKREYTAALSLSLALAATAWWTVPFSLEYTWVCMIALAGCLIAIRLSEQEREERYGMLFLLLGMVTNYLDFLTAETLTLTMPLLLLLWLERKKKSSFKNVLKAAALWLAGYAGMWVLKWILTGVVFGENPMPYVMGHIEQRLGGNIRGNVLSESLPVFMLAALYRNISSLLPFGFGAAGTIAAAVLLVAVIVFVILYHRKDYDRNRILLMAMLALLPFVRILVLHNHAYIHSFFVFRALAATVMAGVLILGEITGPDPFRRKHGSTS